MRASGENFVEAVDIGEDSTAALPVLQLGEHGGHGDAAELDNAGAAFIGAAGTIVGRSVPGLAAGNELTATDAALHATRVSCTKL
mmetsp:Transcript_33956/g.97821  ORF Transcript_33956/g.97821 Transcript_33956/m.97821 type:complete len:85 (+) Transcript_33956:259-513(+)